MATADEILAGAVEVASEEPTEDKILRIDNELRTISIPSAVKLLGVESDEDVNVIEFEMPRYYGEFDLSGFSVRVNYLNANGEGDIYKVTDLSVGEQTMTFSWLVGRFASAYKGTVQFIVCLKKLTEELVVEKEFNTTLAHLPVLEGLETDQQVIQNYPDIIEQILKYMETPISSEEIGKAVEEYLKDNPVGGATINDEEVSAGSVWSSQKSSLQIGEKVSEHNTDQTTHADIRNLIVGLTNRLNALADSDDTTLDQLSEIVAYIKSNKGLIDAITTSKVSVSDIVDDLVTNSSNKPLSAAQGVKLKALIDAIVPVTVDAALSSTSTNPVQNKAVLSGLNEKENKGAVRSVQIGSDTYSPDESGVVTLPEQEGGSGVPDGGTAGQILIKQSDADGDAIWKTPTAEDVGARSNTWMPSASQVGALPENATAADAEKLGGVAASEYLKTSETAADAAKLGGVDAGDYMKKTDRVAWEKIGSVVGSETTIAVPACTELLICAMCRNNSTYSFSSIAFPYSYLDDSYKALYTYARDGYVRFLWNKGTVKLVSSEMDGTDATSTTTVEVYTR